MRRTSANHRKWSQGLSRPSSSTQLYGKESGKRPVIWVTMKLTIRNGGLNLRQFHLSLVSFIESTGRQFAEILAPRPGAFVESMGLEL